MAHRGLVRWLALILVIAAPVLILVTFALHSLLWVAIVGVALLALAAGAGRMALRTDGAQTGPSAVPAGRPQHPFLIMNPHSGGGKVTKFRLQEKAEALGAEVALLEGPGTVDVAALARRAVAGGADLLGVAGGDGTQALVAGIAAGHGLPFLVISAGTRNHFALDLGLDRDDPATCLDALTDGEELAVDLGVIGDRTFVNNASFGAYAEVVRSPAYRDDKRGTTLQMLPGLLNGHQGARLSVRAGAASIDGPQALLVSNNPYGMGDIAGLGRRPRMDTGTLGVIAVLVDSARQAAGLVRRGHGGGLIALAADEVVVDADVPQIPVGIDGETMHDADPGAVHDPPPGAPRDRAQAAAWGARRQATAGMDPAPAARRIPRAPGRGTGRAAVLGGSHGTGTHRDRRPRRARKGGKRADGYSDRP